MTNEYMPFLSQIKEIIPHTDVEYTLLFLTQMSNIHSV